MENQLVELNELDKKIINHLQGGFPVCEKPWDELQLTLDIPAEEIISRIEAMKEAGIISRFGPMYDAKKMGGGLTLAAMKVKTEDFDKVADVVNRFSEVAHNYAREHELNMWFVIATELPHQIEKVIADIQHITGLQVYNMPKQKEFFLGLKFEV